MAKTNFRPQIDGFAFSNSWDLSSGEISQVRGAFDAGVIAAGAFLAPLFGGLGTLGVAAALAYWIARGSPLEYGLCGGMAFAALDYYKLGWVAQRGTGGSDQPTSATPAGATLRNYLWSRLLESLNANVVTFLAWTAILKLVPGGWPFYGGAGWLLSKSKEHWNTLKGHIDAGDPWPIGLVGTTIIPFFNHQVLAYGYDDPGDGTGTIYVYDMNCPGMENTIFLDFRGQVLATTESCPSTDRGPLQGFFCENYSPATPPVGLGLSQGLSVSASGTVNSGDTVQFSLTASNYGFSSSPSLTLYVAGRVVDTGQVYDPGGESTMASIAMGESRQLVKSAQLTGPTGMRRFTAWCHLGSVDRVDVWKSIPAVGAGTEASLDIEVLQPLQPEPFIVASTYAHNFGAVLPGNSADFSFQVSNIGELPLNITNVSAPTNPAFTLVTSLPPTIAPSETRPLTVRFAPTDTSLYSATITITSNAHNRPSLTLTLRGGEGKVEEKEHKEHKEHKEEKDKDAAKEHAKDIDVSSLTLRENEPTLGDSSAGLVDRIEGEGASRRAFIRPEERPVVGEAALAQPDEPHLD